MTDAERLVANVALRLQAPVMVVIHTSMGDQHVELLEYESSEWVWVRMPNSSQALYKSTSLMELRP